MKPAHRDDLPFEVVEQIEAAFAKIAPGFKVQFLGDHPGEMPADLKEKLEGFEQRIHEAFVEGRCMDCGKKMPGEWPPADEDKWEVPEGWHYLTQPNGDPLGFSCDECDSSIPTLTDNTDALELEEYTISEEEFEVDDSWQTAVPEEIIEIVTNTDDESPVALGVHPEKGKFILIADPGKRILWKEWTD